MNGPSLRTLIARTTLGLHLIGHVDAALDRPLRWVHSSDLADPTPFLADDLVLLTTGIQLRSETTADDYVARLVARGVVALGFGVGVHWPEPPAELVAACAHEELALFTVPLATPFIAVARAHSEAIAAEVYARSTWAVDAQRSLALAALRPRGLEATLAELAKRLGTWVGMFDVTGILVHEFPHASIGDSVRDEIAARTATLATRAGLASQSLTIEDRPFILFTLGSGGQVKGVIALESAPLDPESRAVVTSAIAMAGLALEQNAQLARGQRRLRSQVLASLLLDDPALGRRVLGALPSGPIVVAVADSDAPIDALIQWWERRGRAGFTAESSDGFTMVESATQDSVFDEVAERFGIRLGISATHGYDTFSRAHAQALTALRRGHLAQAVRFVDAASSNVLGAFATEEARLVAESRLAPLRGDDDLERTLRVWLEHDARLEPAAEALGIHRHTLRARIARAARLLDSDLASFPARAELWATFHAADAGT